jgi:hypothetical protein
MIEILPPLGKYKYVTCRILPMKCYIDNSVCLQNCIRNVNTPLGMVSEDHWWTHHQGMGKPSEWSISRWKIGLSSRNFFRLSRGVRKHIDVEAWRSPHWENGFLAKTKMLNSSDSNPSAKSKSWGEVNKRTLLDHLLLAYRFLFDWDKCGYLTRKMLLCKNPYRTSTMRWIMR